MRYHKTENYFYSDLAFKNAGRNFVLFLSEKHRQYVNLMIK